MEFPARPSSKRRWPKFGASLLALLSLATASLHAPIVAAAGPESCFTAMQKARVELGSGSKTVATFQKSLSTAVADDLEKALSKGRLTTDEAAKWAEAAQGPLGKNLSKEELDKRVAAALKRLDDPEALKYPKPLFPVEADAEIVTLRKKIILMQRWEEELPAVRKELAVLNKGKGISTPYTKEIAARREKFWAEAIEDWKIKNPGKELDGPTRGKLLAPEVEKKMRLDPEGIAAKQKEDAWIAARKVDLETKIKKTENVTSELKPLQQKYDAATKPYFDQIPDARDRGFPYGFASKEDFKKFGDRYSSGLKKTLTDNFGAGADVHLAPQIEGSSVTGRSFAIKGEKSMSTMTGIHSDYDVAVEIPNDLFDKIMNRLKTFSADNPALTERSGGWSPGLTFEDPNSEMGKLVKKIGLSDFLNDIQTSSGRKTSVMFYRPGAIAKRADAASMAFIGP